MTATRTGINLLHATVWHDVQGYGGSGTVL